MSAVQIQGTAPAERTSSPTLLSNNPFRNRTTSPTNSITASPINATFNLPNAAPERPTSRNPFLDQTESSTNARPTSPLKESVTMESTSSHGKPAMTGHAVELFDNLSLNSRPTTNEYNTRREGPPPASNRPRTANRSENVRPQQRMPPAGHHPSRSQEERPQGNGPRLVRRGTEETNVFADPPKSSRTRLRRNSDTSIASKMLSPEDEQRRRERHRREREARQKDGKSRHHGSKSKKPNQRLDIIDSLDVTSIYGKGLFHHDGPFDACNPDRNKKGSRRAPMEAFAKDSANNVIGGSGPVHSNIDLAQFHGQTEQGFNDYSKSATVVNAAAPPGSYLGSSALNRKGRGTMTPGQDRQSAFNPTEIVQQVHGQESLGLGTSTFLEGTPAAKTVIQRRESESDNVNGEAGGLGRKRSLAQRIRGISNAGRDRTYRPPISSNNRVTSPDNALENAGSARPGMVSGESQSAGGMPRIHESKPFFQDYDGGERKAQNITIAEDQNKYGDGRRDSFGAGEETFTVGGKELRGQATAENSAGAIPATRARAFSSPKREPLQRSITHDGSGAGAEGAKEAGGGGFLSRVKSLKGGKKKGTVKE